jgi:hypothetical protein
VKKEAFWGRVKAALFSTLKETFTKERIYKFLKERIYKFLQTEVVKYALKKVAGTILATSFGGWIIKFVVEELFEDLLIPAMNLALRKSKLKMRIHRGKIQVLALDKAKDEHDEDAYNILIDDA